MMYCTFCTVFYVGAEKKRLYTTLRGIIRPSYNKRDFVITKCHGASTVRLNQTCAGVGVAPRVLYCTLSVCCCASYNSSSDV